MTTDTAAVPSGTISHEDVDRTFVPRLRDEVVLVPVAEEAILYEEETGDLHRLDAIGAVVCQLFDGAAPLDDLAGDLAEAFGAPREVVEADVLTLARELGRKGLLRGVAAETPADPDTDGDDTDDDAAAADAPSAVDPPEAPDDVC